MPACVPPQTALPRKQPEPKRVARAQDAHPRMLRAPDLWSSLIAAALGATALWWQLRTLRSLAGHLDVMALNLLLTLAACGARHGVHGVFVHLLETAKDLGGPCWVCLQGPHMPFRALCEDLFLALCLWSNYMFAWPVFLVVAAALVQAYALGRYTSTHT